MAGGNASINQILSTTLTKWLEKKFVDNVFKARVLSWTLMKQDNMRKVDGGETIFVPVLEGTNGTVMTYADDEELRVLRQKGLTGAKFNWGQAAVSVTVTGIEEAKNNGESKIISLLEAKTEQAEESFRAYFNKVFFGKGGPSTDGSSISPNALNVSAMDPSVYWYGLGDFMTATVLTIGGLTGTTIQENVQAANTVADATLKQVAGASGNMGASYPTAEAGVAGTAAPGIGIRPAGFWIPTTGAVAAPATGLTGSYDLVDGKRKMRTVYNTASIGNDQPQLVLTTQLLFEAYEDSLTDQIRYTNTEMADAGFQNLAFKGAAITYDADQTAHVMDFLNMRYLELVGHQDTWFKSTPFVKPTNRDARTSQILCYGQLTVKKRSAQGRLTFTPKP